jgi:hypothetical protein
MCTRRQILTGQWQQGGGDGWIMFKLILKELDVAQEGLCVM